MPYSKKKSECERECARSKLHAIGRMHVAKKAKNDCWPFKDDRRLDQNIPLDDQRASLVAQLITEADSVNRLSLREQICLLDARKAEDELLASKVPDLEVLLLTARAIVSGRPYQCS